MINAFSWKKKQKKKTHTHKHRLLLSNIIKYFKVLLREFAFNMKFIENEIEMKIFNFDVP